MNREEEFKRHFDKAEVVERTLLVGATVVLNRCATVLELLVAATHPQFFKNDGVLV